MTYLRHLTDNASCACGHERDNAEHYSLFCLWFNGVSSNTVYNHLPEHIHTAILLSGNLDLNYETNMLSFGEYFSILIQIYLK